MGLAVGDFLQEGTKNIADFFTRQKEGGDGKTEMKTSTELEEQGEMPVKTGFFAKFSSHGMKRKLEDTSPESMDRSKKFRSSEVTGVFTPQENLMSSQETEDINVSHCPSDYDTSVWQQLPPEVRMEVLEERRSGGGGASGSAVDEA